LPNHTSSTLGRAAALIATTMTTPTTPSTTTSSPAADATGASADLATTLRWALLGIAGVTIVGTALELASIRHWTEKSQLLAWACLVGLTIALVAIARGPHGRLVQLIRLGLLGVCAVAVVAMAVHVHGNYEAGPLDAVYGPDWDTMSAGARWWAALVKSVGPSPALAPGVLIVSSLCLLAATTGLSTRRDA
jgi:uncharacterized membrane protein YqjE